MSKQNSSKTKPLSEAHIQATCSEWLGLDDWRLIRTDLPHLRGLGVSELGIADSLYIRYHNEDNVWLAQQQYQSVRNFAHSRTQVLWIEWKKKGGKTAQHQRDWHAKERARGALTLIAGEDFPASIEGFAEWYQASGLQRKRISIPRA